MKSKNVLEWSQFLLYKTGSTLPYLLTNQTESIQALQGAFKGYLIIDDSCCQIPECYWMYINILL